MNTVKFLEKYGTWAVITGASDGIGRAFAEQLALMGMNLALVARRREVLTQISADISRKDGVETKVIVADLGTPEGLQLVDQQTVGLDVGLFIASAGFGTSGPAIDSNLHQEHDMLEVNCFALLHGSVVFGRRLRERGGGGIILMSSLVGWQGTPMSAHYAATKAYVQSFSEALHLELKSSKVDVLASAPGPVDSGFATRADMVMGAAVSPAAVAKSTLAALGNKTTVVPGGLSKVLTWSLTPLPRSLRARIMGQVMSGMTKHQRPAS